MIKSNFITLSSNGVQHGPFTKKQYEFMKKALHINEVEGKSFSLRDFPEISPESFRQYVYKLRNYIELDVHGFPNFYKIKGTNSIVRHQKYKNLSYSTIGNNMSDVFENLTPRSLVLNNIKLSFDSNKKFYNCINNTCDKFVESDKPIILEDMEIDEYNIKIEIMSDITYVNINSNDKPILHDMIGVLRFTEVLGIISAHLHTCSLNIIQIPSICEWKCISYSLGRDVKYQYDNPKFHRTWKDMAGGFMKVFYRWEKDNLVDIIFDKCHCCSKTADVLQVIK